MDDLDLQAFLEEIEKAFDEHAFTPETDHQFLPNEGVLTERGHLSEACAAKASETKDQFLA